MTGVITDRLIPSKISIFRGPPITPELTGELNDGNLEIQLMERISEGMADYVVLFINETTLGLSPQLEIKVTGKFVVNVILDSSAEMNLISEEISEKLMKAAVQIPVLPVENVVLVTTFGERSRRIRSQVLIELRTRYLSH
jgi:hypothetical protein